MELGLRLDGKQDVFLRVPTVWDAVENQWIGWLKLPESKKLITGKGKDSFELQNNFNVEMSKVFHDPEYSKEAFSLFKPLEYWEARK
jgi:hypothetical protein